MQQSWSTDLENCPVSDDLMKRLLDATLNAVTEVSNQLSENQRAALAVYCYRRSHFRQLGLSLAAQCSRQSLVMEAGHAGEVIHAQASVEDTSPDRQPGRRSHGGRAPVSLHTV